MPERSLDTRACAQKRLWISRVEAGFLAWAGMDKHMPSCLLKHDLAMVYSTHCLTSRTEGEHDIT